MYTDHHQADYGTSQKKLSVYLVGFVTCIALTLGAFYLVMYPSLPKHQIMAWVLAAAFIQFFVQVICFLGLNVKTLQGKMNVGSLIYAIVVIGSIIVGSLWIMYNLDYFMMN